MPLLVREPTGPVGEHEEVGPSYHTLFSYDGKKIRPLWSGTAPTFYVDKSWHTEGVDCNEAGTEVITTTVVHRLVGEKVEETVVRRSRAAEEYDCLDPDDP